MRIKNKFVLVAATAVLALGLSACSNDKEPANEDAQETPAAVPEPTGLDKDRDKKDEKVTYTDPSQAKDFCGVFASMEKMNKEEQGQTQEKANAQFLERMDIITRSAEKLSEFAEGDKEKKQWSEMGKKYAEAADFFKSSGGTVANDDFLALFAEAVQSSNSAFEDQAPKVKEECGIDTDQFVAKGDDSKDEKSKDKKKDD